MTIDNHCVDHIDIDRYMGNWYEIARIDNWFEKGLVGVTAIYDRIDKNTISVINCGYKNNFDGEFFCKKGKGRIPDENEPAHLEISFFLWFYSDYNIMELDQRNYEYALVGTDSKDYLWILSRKQVLPETIKKILLNKESERGYDISRLIFTKQQNQIKTQVKSLCFKHFLYLFDSYP